MLSPYLKMNEGEKEILHIFEGIEVKEILKDKEIAKILKFTLLGFEILYESKKHLDNRADIIGYLEEVKGMLFEKGKIKNLK